MDSILWSYWAIERGKPTLARALADGGQNLAGPILLLLGVVVLNVVMIAAAIWLRRRLRAIEEEKPKK